MEKTRGVLDAASIRNCYPRTIWMLSDYIVRVRPGESASEVVFREEITEGERLEVLLKG